MKILKYLFILALILSQFCFCPIAHAEATVPDKDLAVILIDMQQFFLDRFEHDDGKNIVIHQKTVLKYCAKNDIPVIVLEYRGFRNTIMPLLQDVVRVKRKWIIIKDNDNGFINTELDELLKTLHVKKVLLMGINAEACVMSTARGALEKGYEVLSCRKLMASAWKDDEGLKSSAKWYSGIGLFFENTALLFKHIGYPE